MPFMEWSDNFTVGVAEIDAEHKKLVALLNEVYDAHEAGGGHDAVSRVLDELVQYVDYHFKHEEGLFIRARYPE
ncbi:MAG: hemerythrin domain-containing protein, partial [Alphaproteobacteria bacterium]|nr:hemerythrin domain-containing protein [Alphaproteobacteria bacterium]